MRTTRLVGVAVALVIAPAVCAEPREGKNPTAIVVGDYIQLAGTILSGVGPKRTRPEPCVMRLARPVRIYRRTGEGRRVLVGATDSLEVISDPSVRRSCTVGSKVVYAGSVSDGVQWGGRSAPVPPVAFGVYEVLSE